MKIIVGGRASGKTTKLIQESAETGRRILTYNKESVERICCQALGLGYDIPTPLSVNDLKPETKAEIKKQGIIIDDLEPILSSLCGCTVHSATYGCENAPLMEIATRDGMKVFNIKNVIVRRKQE